MAICERTDPHPCSYGCELRQAGGLQVSPKATPNRRNNVAPRKPDPAWERGTVKDKRPGGFEVPIMEPGTKHPLHVKQYAERRHEIDSGLKRLKTHPRPFD